MRDASRAEPGPALDGRGPAADTQARNSPPSPPRAAVASPAPTEASAMARTDSRPITCPYCGAPLKAGRGPRYDEARRQLWLDGVLVKAFRQPAASQMAVLAAFEAAGWPGVIDDPLAQEDG